MKSLLICAIFLLGFLQAAGQKIQPEVHFPVLGFLTVETGAQLNVGFTLEEGMGGVEKDWNWEWVSLPEFPGGFSEFKNYLRASNIGFEPDWDLDNNEHIYIRFRIDNEGYVSDVKVIRGGEEDQDVTCLRAIYGLPKWEPASYAGRKVPCWFSLILDLKGD